MISFPYSLPAAFFLPLPSSCRQRLIIRSQNKPKSSIITAVTCIAQRPATSRSVADTTTNIYSTQITYPVNISNKQSPILLRYLDTRSHAPKKEIRTFRRIILFHPHSIRESHIYNYTVDTVGFLLIYSSQYIIGRPPFFML